MAPTSIFSGTDNAYLAPMPFNTRGEIACKPDEVHDWASNIVVDGRSYLRSQPSYQYIQEGIDLVNGDSDQVKIATLSDYKSELTMRNLKEINASQTNIRVIPAFKSNTHEFNGQEQILNNGFMAWQNAVFFDRGLRRAWQWATAAGTGYLGCRWDANYWYRGRGDLVVDAYGPLDVLPVGMGKQHDLQKAYAVALKVATPVHEAWRLFPLYVDKIRASRENSMGRGTVISQAVRFASAVLRRWGPNASIENERLPWQSLDIYYIYVDDDSVNNSGRPIPMGQPGTSWFYIVPFIGQELKMGETSGGQAITRKAMREDCQLYPNRRLIICTEHGCLNPDPSTQVSPFWHARVPVVQLRADDWPWTFLGFPITRYGANIEKNNNQIQRGMTDAMNARLSPPRAFDRNTTAKALMETMNTRVPDQVVGLDFTFGSESPVRPLLPMGWYEFPAYYGALIQQNEQRITQQMGVADAAALSRARQLPSGDSVEKIMETLGPLVKDMSRNMEASIRDFGEMWKSNFFQFYTAPRRMQLLGPDGLADEDFDFDPGTLIPTSETMIQMRKIGIVSEGVPYFERARWHKDHFSFSVTPYSLHELNSMTRRLFILQLQKSGFPLDWWTMAEMFDVKNFGDPPMMTDPITGDVRAASSVMERWTCQMEIMAHIQAASQAESQAGEPPQGGPPAPPPGGGAGAPMPGAPHKGPGRPGSMQEPPVLEQKSGDAGTRSTIRESKR
jgi:hypothetical protein